LGDTTVHCCCVLLPWGVIVAEVDDGYGYGERPCGRRGSWSGGLLGQARDDLRVLGRWAAAALEEGSRMMGLIERGRELLTMAPYSLFKNLKNVPKDSSISAKLC